MADAQTNPVLQVIPLDFVVEENKKYPTNYLQFQNLGWRAYYHCHPASRAGNHRFQGEHGHFHIFVKINKKPETWSHLVALAMDNMGQPLGWFSVNHWVTGEVWESAEHLIEFLNKIPYAEQEGLVEKWLLSILDLSHDLIELILYERDKLISLEQNKSTDTEVKQDKNLYLLSETPVNIKTLLNT